MANAWLTFFVLIVTFAVWAFSNMGDCPANEIRNRAAWLDFTIVGIGIVVWAIGLSLVVRRKQI